MFVIGRELCKALFPVRFSLGFSLIGSRSIILRYNYMTGYYLASIKLIGTLV